MKGTVEIDETFIGGKSEGKRGQGAEGKTQGAIAVEIMKKGTGRVRMAIISDASKKHWVNSFLRI